MMALPAVTPTPRPLSSALRAAEAFSAGVPRAPGPRMASGPMAWTVLCLTARLPRIWASDWATASASSGWPRSLVPTRG